MLFLLQVSSYEWFQIEKLYIKCNAKQLYNLNVRFEKFLALYRNKKKIKENHNIDARLDDETICREDLF
jgi:hypothetical protein